MSLTDTLIVLLAMLVLSLDSKLWAKLDRVVGFVIMQKAEMIEKLNECAKRIEELEIRLRNKQ